VQAAVRGQAWLPPTELAPGPAQAPVREQVPAGKPEAASPLQPAGQREPAEAEARAQAQAVVAPPPLLPEQALPEAPV
jgi:hypothetical protein